MNETIIQSLPWIIPLILVLAIWDAVWRLIASWRAARSGHLIWFICLNVFGTIGILPIVYLLLSRREKAPSGPEPAQAQPTN